VIALCIVGVGQSEFTKRGVLRDRGTLGLARDAIHGPAKDAGIDVREIDGFSSFASDETPASDITHAVRLRRWAFNAMDRAVWALLFRERSRTRPWPLRQVAHST
jgi:hypothetical protein